MKKLISILAMMMIAILAVSCACAETVNTDEEIYGGDMETAGYGPNFEMTLPANPSTGYEWALNIVDGEGVVSFVTDYNAAESEVPMLGAAGTQWFRLDGEAEGTFTVELTYARANEENFAYKYILNGIVTEDMSVIVCSMEFVVGTL